MRTVLGVILLTAAFAGGLDAQRRGGALATLAIFVTDPAGTPLHDVKVTVQGPASRQTRTERGRIAIEELPAGAYTLRFDLDGYVPLERELTARGGKPIEVKVTLNPAPKPPPPPAPQPPPAAPLIKVDPAAIDVREFFERNRRDATSWSLTCASAGTAVLMQFREPEGDHTHAALDEFVYVVDGQGTARVGAADHKLHAGVLLMVPRAVVHSFTPRGRGPLVLLSIAAGQPCRK